MSASLALGVPPGSFGDDQAGMIRAGQAGGVAGDKGRRT